MTKEELLELIKNNPKGYFNTLRFKHKDFLADIANLPYNSLGEKLYRYLYPQVIPKCLQCSNLCNFKQLSHGYFDYCSSSCRAIAKQSNLNGLTEYSNEKRNLWRQTLTSDDKKEIYDRVKTTNICRYGVEHRFQDKEYIKELTKTVSIKKYGEVTYNKLSDPVWLAEEYENKTITKIATELNVSYGTICTYIRKYGLKSNKTNKSSKEENEIVTYLKSLGIVDMIQNDTTLLTPKEIDIFIPSHNLAIEYCGSYWHSDSNKYLHSSRASPTYHQKKFTELQKKKIKLVTIFDIDWKLKSDIIKSRLKNILTKTSNLIYARKCNIRLLESKDSKQFFNTNHLAGFCGSKLCFGLYYNGLLVSAMSFKTPRFNKKYEWEMIRFASLLDYNIIGGASKLFSYFMKNYKPKSVISYADNCWGSGEVYSKLRFSLLKITSPSYYYVDIKKMDKKYHRYCFTKKRILEHLKGDLKLTEHENMKKLGFYRIWDCGTTSWEIKIDD